jgi:hypothetical protein
MRNTASSRPAVNPERPLPPRTRLMLRLPKHPHLLHYNRLVGLVMAANVALLGYGLTGGGWWSSEGIALGTVMFVAQVNFALAIIVRQQYVVNGLSWLATRARPCWPLRLRWGLAKVYHLGGLHVGAAGSGSLWYVAFVGSLTYSATQDRDHVSGGNLVVSYVLVMLYIVMVVMALPPLRRRNHDSFEATHRFCGWAALVLVWANTVLSVRDQGGGASALLTAPTVWLLLITTTSTLLPWLRLRRVPVTVERPSSHVALVAFDQGATPIIGSTKPISHNPLLGWHTFASIPSTAQSSGGCRMVVSRAGDWTGRFIDDPPSHVWVRGIPTAGMANVSTIFRKVVFVATGSGIGPMLAHLLANRVPSHLLWVTRSPRRTFGDALVDEILAAQPDATVWDTDELGRPDMLRLAHAAYELHDAEAVICIANKKTTWQVVHGLESRGIPAFGPIWDS